jgi:uncharacterized membrane protein
MIHMSFSQFFTPRIDSASMATIRLLRKLEVPVTRTTVIETIEKQPYPSSLYAISRSLDQWNVPNAALETDAERLDDLPLPFIIFLKTGKGVFHLVTDIGQQTICYVTGSGTERTVMRETFLEDWEGVVLVAEANQSSGEKNYPARKRQEWLEHFRIPSVIGLCFGLMALFFLSGSSPDHGWLSLLLSLKFAGMVITALLLWWEADPSQQFLKQVCSGRKRGNCNAVLASTAARPFMGVSWSEIGFVYFAGGFLFILLGNSLTELLGWLSLFSIPFIFFSIFYQWRIVRQWCALCLLVQALLFAETMTGFLAGWLRSANQPSDLQPLQLIPLLTSFCLPLCFLILTKKAYRALGVAKHYEREIAQLKFNKEVFQVLLQRQKKVTVPGDLGIMLGDPAARHTLVQVCNPYCGPCARAHKVIEELIEGNRDIRVQIIFTATDDERDIRSAPVKYLMALYESDRSGSIKQALDNWYATGMKDYDAFASRYGLNGELQRQGKKLEAMARWCEEAEIELTPTFFLDGHLLPEEYSIDQIRYVLEE